MDDSQPVVRVPTHALGVGEHTDTVRPFDLILRALTGIGRQLIRSAEPGVIEGSTKNGHALHDQHVSARAGRLQRRGQSGGAATHDGHVAMQVRLFERPWPAAQLDPAEAGGPPDKAFPEIPNADRPKKGVIVETDRQETRELVEQKGEIPFQASDIVLAFDPQVIFNFSQIRVDIRFIADLD